MKKITILVLTLSFSISVFSQIIIKGTVTNDSIPLESASVIIKNSIKGIATNSKGQFKIEAKKGDTLSISYLGYENKEMVVKNGKYLKIKLVEGVELDEVVVIGYDPHSFCKTTCCGVFVRYETYWIDEIKKIKLYPNPSSNGIFQLKLTQDYDEVQISIANISGQIVQNSIHQKFREKVNIDLSQFLTGIYIVNIIADGKRLEPVKAVRS